VSDQPPWRSTLYLESFHDFASAGRLRAALELGQTLGALHQVVSYHLIARACEPAVRRDWAGALDFWLRRLFARCP
jgi:hypothetical protein